MPKDALDELIAQLRAAVPDYPADKLEAAALRIRRDIGGAAAYIKKAPAEGKAWGLGTALAAGAPLAQAFADAGISRAYGYKLLRRRWLVR